MLLFAAVLALVLTLLAVVHWYVWRRLVRDVTRPGSALRRAGTAAAVALPLLSLGALTASRAGAPFWLQQVVAWPGQMWLALLLYLVLALLVTEALRPVLMRWPRPRGSADHPVRSADAPAPGGASASAPGGSPAPASGAGRAAASPAGAGPAPAAPGGPRPAAAPAATAVAEAAGPEPAGEATEPEAPQSPGQESAGQEAPEPRPQGPAGEEARPQGPAGGMPRRLFVSRVLGGGAAAAATATVGYGTYGVLRGPQVKRVTVPLARLPRAAHGLRVAVVSDIHIGPILGRAHTQRIVDTINRTQPDLVAVVGDLVDGSVENLGHAAEPLAQLRARYGSFFVTGNHEYFSGAEEWVEEVRELGLRPLRNERVEVPGGFDLAGVNDVAGANYGDGPDFARALGDRDPARAAVLLAHQPVLIQEAVRHGVDLQLSGHTHGGQMWPANHLAELANPTLAGLEQYGDTQLYVSRGAGAWGPPVRVGAPSDITVVQLASRQA
ncbi:metallophosphoesterase [Streptomyces sp. CC228A]|uniref:metallophosphoesterase n=1 Tax=Streptomyces sp. CC228A TaxID=2898186 RepID=UPI001F269F54|nr:metallophosphoesterase [Streptomyces sp. CC228A]